MNPQVLRKYRLKKGLKMKELAASVNRTEGWYSRIESGKTALSPRYIEPLAEIFGIRPDRLAKELFSGLKLELNSK